MESVKRGSLAVFMGWLCWYSVTGLKNTFGNFSSGRCILDPYALVAVEPDGPGIVVSLGGLERGDCFQLLAWQNLAIV